MSTPEALLWYVSQHATKPWSPLVSRHLWKSWRERKSAVALWMRGDTAAQMATIRFEIRILVAEEVRYEFEMNKGSSHTDVWWRWCYVGYWSYSSWIALGVLIRRFGVVASGKHMNRIESPFLLGKVAHGFSSLVMWSMAKRHARARKRAVTPLNTREHNYLKYMSCK